MTRNCTYDRILVALALYLELFFFWVLVYCAEAACLCYTLLATRIGEGMGGGRLGGEVFKSMSLFSDVSHPSGFASVWQTFTYSSRISTFSLLLILLLVRLLVWWGIGLSNIYLEFFCFIFVSFWEMRQTYPQGSRKRWGREKTHGRLSPPLPHHASPSA